MLGFLTKLSREVANIQNRSSTGLETHTMIVDASLMFNELALLEVRLHELSDVVDRFVVVESTHTFSGKTKPLFFHDNKDRFSAFIKRIDHVIYSPPNARMRSWSREFQQRDSILRATAELKDDTWIVLSDQDEIVRQEILKVACSSSSQLVLLQLRNYYYYVNCRGVTEPWWTGLKMARLGAIRESPQKQLRDLPSDDPRFLTVRDAGWHWSFLGGATQVRQKIQAFSHTEYDIPEFTDISFVEKRIGNLTDPFDRGLAWKRVPIDETYPKYLLENLGKFRDWILP